MSDDLHKCSVLSEKSRDSAVLIAVDIECGRSLWKSGHCKDVSGVYYHESCTWWQLCITDSYLEILWLSEKIWVIRKWILSLCNTDRDVPETDILDLLDSLFCLRSEYNSVSTIDLLSDLLNLILDGSLCIVNGLEFVSADKVDSLAYLLSQILAAFAALGEYLAHRYLNAHISAEVLYELYFLVRICCKSVDGNNYGNVILMHILDVSSQVLDTLFKSPHILLCKVLLLNSAVVLQSLDGSYKDNAWGSKSADTALDVQELLSTEVWTEACLCNCIVAQLESKLCSSQRIAAVSDICKRTAVDKRGSILQSLHKIGLESVLEEGCHSACAAEVLSVDRLAAEIICNEDISRDVPWDQRYRKQDRV